MSDPTTAIHSFDEEAISELLLQWEERHAAGEDVNIAQLCGNDESLQRELARRVAMLLKMNQVLGDDETAASTPKTNRVNSSQPASPPTPPGYELLNELGRGGMGVVYQARQLSLDRIVALKMIIGGGLATPTQRKRFQAEAESVARLQHANIVQIHDVGVHHDLPYCALEYLSGGTLAEQLAGEPLPAKQAAHLVRTLCQAVQAAHKKSIVHRDLKPGNILSTEQGEWKVADFGLAKCLDSDSDSTRTGDVLGTPSYMAPEQASGRSAHVGVATDVYALGAILYETITGRPPFRATSPIETITQVIKNEPVAPSRLQPNLPRDLETICLKCLHKSPSQRYESAQALADDLERFIDGKPIVARPTGAAERLIKFVKRNRAFSAIVGLVLLGLLAGMTIVAVYNSWLQIEQSKLTAANDRLINQSEELRQTKETAETQREAALAALEEKNRLLSLSFVAYGRACSLAAKIANLDDSVVVSASRSKQINNQALVQFKLQHDLLQKAGDPSIQTTLDAYWQALQQTSNTTDRAELKRLSLNLAIACGKAWREETASMPQLQQSISNHLYQRACDAADRLAAADDLNQVNHSFDEFWELYWGELAIVESKQVEQKMIAFGKLLKQRKRETREQAIAELREPMMQAAAELRAACGLDDSA